MRALRLPSLATLQAFRPTRRQLIGIGMAILVPSAWLLARGPAAPDNSLVARVKRGPFSVTVTTSGELRARQFVQITAPAGAQQAGAWQMKIQSIVPEGTIVKQGDVVAELDRSTLANKLDEVRLALQKAEAQYEQAMLDSTLTLSTARENIRTMELALEEKRLAKEQAVYEAPTVQRQAAIDYERAIRAPAPGMVIYVKEWNGRKRTAGSQVNAWEPGVATLPDLTQMESVTYVNEIDVRKLAVGQPVTLTLDADPTKHLTGTVASVANVGEQRPNADAKVFEVKVTVQGSDTTLRPGMTTGNAIETLKLNVALYVPLEAVSSAGGIPFVYQQDGGRIVKQEVITGPMNDDEVVIVRGLEENDRVLLSPPPDHDRIALTRLPASVRDSLPVAGGDTAPRGGIAVPPPAR